LAAGRVVFRKIVRVRKCERRKSGEKQDEYQDEFQDEFSFHVCSQIERVKFTSFFAVEISRANANARPAAAALAVLIVRGNA